MQTGSSSDLTTRETAMVQALVYMFVHEATYDALHYALHNSAEREELEGEIEPDALIPPELLRRAARRELLLEEGLVTDLELMYAVQFLGAEVPPDKADDAQYAQRVREVMEAQKLCHGLANWEMLAQRACERAGNRLDTDGSLGETDECALCDDLDEFEEQEIPDKGLRSVLWNAIEKL